MRSNLNYFPAAAKAAAAAPPPPPAPTAPPKKNVSMKEEAPEVASPERCHDYSNVGLGSSLRGEPGLTTFRSQGCP